jgi:prolyl-tRNA editing enzyme YbaK/EbsC (Cys-tRNA(Pro) deacylase)
MGGGDSVERVRAALAGFGLAAGIREFDASTRTSAEAAAAIGCEVAAIAKSLVFVARPSGRAILVIASGANRVDEGKIAAAIGEEVDRADAGLVRAVTGFAIGGVAPVGHGKATEVVIDAELGRHAEIWAAAGAPNAVFVVTPADLLRITGGRMVDLRQESGRQPA